MGVQQVVTTPQFVVLRLILESGERLPCLVDYETWLPARVATRWVMRYRRYHTQSSTLTDNLRILGILYTWARTSGGFDLDDYLTQGNILTPRQIEAFASTLRLPETFMGTDIKGLAPVGGNLGKGIRYIHQYTHEKGEARWM